MERITARRRPGRPQREVGGIEQRPWKQLTRPYAPIEILSDDQVRTIHEMGLTILEEIGMRVLQPRARQFYRAAGADVDEGEMRVRFDRAMVMERVAMAPSSFELRARNPQKNVRQSLSGIEQLLKKYTPSVPVDYKFVDEEFGNKFSAEERIGKLSSYFAILAIFISCLGLLGLAMFTAEQRTREIGIRKVLGASTAGLFTLMSKEFLQLVFIALIIASPLAWWAMNSWLKDYEYRTSISWWVFGIAGLLAVIIALITVSFQAIKASLANPIKSLRSE